MVRIHLLQLQSSLHVQESCSTLLGKKNHCLLKTCRKKQAIKHNTIQAVLRAYQFLKYSTFTFKMTKNQMVRGYQKRYVEKKKIKKL